MNPGEQPMRRAVWVTALILPLLAGCGDPPTTDRRGYTKNILETPAPFVKGQPVSEMDRLGTPIRPDTLPILPADTATAARE